MDLRFLRAFVRTADLGSVSRAAASLNIVQPALSRQIRLLEAELGVALFVRHRRGVELTEAGRLLRQRAETIMEAVEDARICVAGVGSEPSGPVGLGLPTSMLYVLSPQLVTTYCRRYPRAFLRVHESLGHVIEALLREGQIDVAILISPQPMQDVSLEPLVSEGLYLTGPPQAGLAPNVTVLPEEVAKVPMVMFGRRNKVRVALEQLLGRQSLSLTPALEVEGQPLALELVRQGLGYTVLPNCAAQAEIASGRLSGAPIAGLTIEWVLGVNRARAGAPAVAALTGLLRELVSAQIARGLWRATVG